MKIIISTVVLKHKRHSEAKSATDEQRKLYLLVNFLLDQVSIVGHTRCLNLVVYIKTRHCKYVYRDFIADLTRQPNSPFDKSINIISNIFY